MIAIITILVILVVNAALTKFFFITPYELLEATGWQHFTGLILIHAPYWLMLAATIFTLYSGISYLIAHKNIFSGQKK